MSIARGQFLGRMEAIASILANPISTDQSPVPAPSSVAVVVRNGCMVMLFCALEAFLRDRSLECARSIDQNVVPYPHLPEKLKYASVVSTFEGLSTQTRNWSDADKIVEYERALVASSAGALGSPFQFTSYSFGRDRSNISVGDVGDIAKSFGVSNFWNSTRNVGANAGMATPGNADETFRQLATARHRAAHVASYIVPHSLLTASLPQAVVIALGFDVLVSTATHRLSRSAISRGQAPAPVSDVDIRFITVAPHRGGWRATRAGVRRALFVELDGTAALARAVGAARNADLSVVCHDMAGRPSNWATVLG